MSESYNQAADIETLEKFAAQLQRTEKLLDALRAAGAFEAAGRRKVLSFCCACCRLIWDELPPIAQQALQVAEQYNAGLVSEEEVDAKRAELWNFWETDPTCRTGYGFSKNREAVRTSNAVRAVVCCLLAKPTDEPDDEYELVSWTMDHCEKTKAGLEELEDQMLLDYFGSEIKMDE